MFKTILNTCLFLVTSIVKYIMYLLCIQPPTTAVSLRLACRFSLIDPNHRSPSFLSFLPLCRSIDRFENHWFPCMQGWMLMFLSRSHFPPYLGYILQPCMVIGPQSRDTEITARASMMRLDHRLHSQENQVNVQANYPSLAINDVFLL